MRGVGSVLSGTVLSGEIILGQQLWLGPSETGTFSIVAVTGIQREQVAPQEQHWHSTLDSVCLSPVRVVQRGPT